MQLTPDQLTRAWHFFKRRGNMLARKDLIIHYQPLVSKVAGQVGAKLPQHVDREDLVSYGLIGLMDALDKFDLDRGNKFETYAPLRISGQIVDELRKLDWVPRSVHTESKNAQSAFLDLQTELQREPTEAEIAERMGVSLQTLAHARSESVLVGVLALDAIVDIDNEMTPSMVSQLHDRTEDPLAYVEIDDIKLLIANAMTVLPERESIVLTLYYFESLTLSDIGRLLQVTESRVCQMHTRAMTQVRNRLAAA